MTRAANERLSKDIIYIYWDDHGQFGNNNPRKTGLYSSPTYTGAKEYQIYNSPHAEDRKKERYILLTGVDEFGKIFQKYEKFSIRDPKPPCR